MSKYRIEHDSMGEFRRVLFRSYGAQTQRAINNFPISGKPMPLAFIKSLLKIKKAVALANHELGELDPEIANAICAAVESLLADEQLLQHFPIDVFQDRKSVV